MGATRRAYRTASMTGLALAYGAVSQRSVPSSVAVPANLAAAGSAVLLARRWGCSWAELGLEPDRLLPGLRDGLGVGAVATALVSGGAAHPRTRPFFGDERVVRASPGEAAYHTVVRIPLGTATTEELLFRSALLAVASRWLGTRRAVLFASVVFGLWHVLPALDAHRSNPATAAATDRVGGRSVAVAGTVALTTVAGIGLSALRLRTRSVAASIAAHAALNAAGFVASRRVGRRASA